MGYLEGLLGGFSQRKGEVEAQNIEEARAANAREASVYTALLNSPDPEIQAMAATGLLESARPQKRKGGLRGWMGEMTESPTFSGLMQLVNTPVKVPGTPDQPSRREFPVIPTQPPTLGEAPAGMASHALTEPGAPPPANIPQPHVVPGQVGTPPSFQRRQLFPSAEQKAYGARMATGQADISLELQRQQVGLSPLHGHALHEGNIHKDAQGNWVQDLYDDIGNVVRTIPAQAPRTAGGSYQVLADQNGKPAVYRLFPDGRKEFVGMKPVTTGKLDYRQAILTARAIEPFADHDALLKLADALMGAEGGSAAGPAEGATGTPGTPTGAEPAASPAVGTPPPATAPATSPGDKIKAAMGPGFGEKTASSGKPLPPQIATTYANIESTNQLIQKALDALEPFKNDNTEEGGMRLAQQYREGVFNPVSTAAAQLADLSGLQAAARSQLSQGTSRALQVYHERRQHTPRLPSVQAAEFGEWLPTSLVGHVSRMRGGGWDTPQMMYQKLQQIKDAGVLAKQAFDKEFPMETTIAAPLGSTGVPPPTKIGESKSYQDPVTGKWHISY